MKISNQLLRMCVSYAIFFFLNKDIYNSIKARWLKLIMMTV